MNDVVIGTCSICGGDVVVPKVWFGVNTPSARCTRCGAMEKRDLPVIPMVPKPVVKRPMAYYGVR